MGLELIILALAVVLVVGYILVRFARLMRITWKRKTRKFLRFRLTTAGPRVVSLYVDFWLWKGQLYPRKARR